MRLLLRKENNHIEVTGNQGSILLPGNFFAVVNCFKEGQRVELNNVYITNHVGNNIVITIISDDKALGAYVFSEEDREQIIKFAKLFS